MRRRVYAACLQEARRISFQEEVLCTKTINTGEPPKGFKWVFCRYRRVRNSDKVLDAHEYGYQAWAFLVRCA